MERFLPKDGVVVATVYASITFPPCPVLVFKINTKTSKYNISQPRPQPRSQALFSDAPSSSEERASEQRAWERD